MFLNKSPRSMKHCYSEAVGHGRAGKVHPIHHPVNPLQQEFIFFFINKIDQHLIYSSKMTLSKCQCSGKQ